MFRRLLFWRSWLYLRFLLFALAPSFRFAIGTNPSLCLLSVVLRCVCGACFGVVREHLTRDAEAFKLGLSQIMTQSYERPRTGSNDKALKAQLLCFGMGYSRSSMHCTAHGFAGVTHDQSSGCFLGAIPRLAHCADRSCRTQRF